MRIFFTICFTVFFSLLSESADESVVSISGMSGEIQASDTISIFVHREADLNTNGQLAKDGTVTMPLIGSIKLAGRTTSSAESLIEAKLLDGYLVRPEVTVRISKRPVHTVSVDGQVNQPGLFTLPHGQPLTLTQVISMAGGSNDVANLSKVSLRSGLTGKVRFINIKDIIKGKKKDIILSKNDYVWVPEGLF